MAIKIKNTADMNEVLSKEHSDKVKFAMGALGGIAFCLVANNDELSVAAVHELNAFLPQTTRFFDGSASRRDLAKYVMAIAQAVIDILSPRVKKGETTPKPTPPVDEPRTPLPRNEKEIRLLRNRLRKAVASENCPGCPKCFSKRVVVEALSWVLGEHNPALEEASEYYAKEMPEIR